MIAAYRLDGLIKLHRPSFRLTISQSKGRRIRRIFSASKGGKDEKCWRSTAQTPVGAFDLRDFNLNCDNNTWKSNTFGSNNQPCIQ